MSTHLDALRSVNETETFAEVNGQLPLIHFPARFQATFRPFEVALN